MKDLIKTMPMDPKLKDMQSVCRLHRPVVEVEIKVIGPELDIYGREEGFKKTPDEMFADGEVTITNAAGNKGVVIRKLTNQFDCQIVVNPDPLKLSAYKEGKFPALTPGREHIRGLAGDLDGDQYFCPTQYHLKATKPKAKYRLANQGYSKRKAKKRYQVAYQYKIKLRYYQAVRKLNKVMNEQWSSLISN